MESPAARGSNRTLASASGWPSNVTTPETGRQWIGAPIAARQDRKYPHNQTHWVDNRPETDAYAQSQIPAKFPLLNITISLTRSYYYRSSR